MKSNGKTSYLFLAIVVIVAVVPGALFLMKDRREITTKPAPAAAEPTAVTTKQAEPAPSNPPAPIVAQTNPAEPTQPAPTATAAPKVEPETAKTSPSDPKPAESPDPSAKSTLDNFPVPVAEQNAIAFTAAADFITAGHYAATQIIGEGKIQVSQVEVACSGTFSNITLAIHQDDNGAPGKLIAKVGQAGYQEDSTQQFRMGLADGPEPITFEKGQSFWLVTSSTGGVNDFVMWKERKANATFPKRAHSRDQGKTWMVEDGGFATRIECKSAAPEPRVEVAKATPAPAPAPTTPELGASPSAGGTPEGIPVELQGTWVVTPAAPSFNQQFRDPEFRIRITATEYVWLTRQENGITSAWDENGEAERLITDVDGKKYFEGVRFTVRVDTNSVPWRIDLSAKNKAGGAIEKKGICELRENTLKLSVGKSGADRPTSFEKTTGNTDYAAFEATRVIEKK